MHSTPIGVVATTAQREFLDYKNYICNKPVTMYCLFTCLLDNSFMDSPAKGGAGRKIPINPLITRLPVLLKPLVEEMSANYRELVTDFE